LLLDEVRLLKLNLSVNEVNAIKAWADKIIHGGHWGDGDIVIPEESIILNKLEGMQNGTLDLKENEAKIILTWSESSMGIHNMEEDSVIKKLQRIVTSGP
jgi:hypothetical protein